MSPFDPEGLKGELAKIDKKINEEGFWDDQEEARKVMKEKKSIEDKLDELEKLNSKMDDLEVLIEMAEEDGTKSFSGRLRRPERSCHHLLRS